MPSLKRYSLSSKRKSCRTVLFIPIVWAAATSWTWAVLSITASTIPRSVQTVRTTLTALRTFGIRQNASCENTTESIVNLSRCSWKNANFDLTSAHRLNSLKSCGIGVGFRANLVQPLRFNSLYLRNGIGYSSSTCLTFGCVVRQLSGCVDGLPCRSLCYATVVCLGWARVAAGRFVAMIREFRYTRVGFSPPINDRKRKNGGLKPTLRNYATVIVGMTGF